MTNKRARFIVALVVGGLGLAITAHADPSIKVDKEAIGTAIDNRELDGAATEFDKSITKLYCWAHLSATQVPAKVHFVWSADGQKEADVTLNVNTQSARLWSSKNIWPAKWKVDITDDAGAVLSTQEFTAKN